jgi:hypothetical protein
MSSLSRDATSATSATSANNTKYIHILHAHQKQLNLRATGDDLAACSAKELLLYLTELQTNRAQLYKTWDQSLRTYCRARDSSETGPTNDADQAKCLAEYYHVTKDMIGAFNSVSGEVKRIQTDCAHRNALEEATTLVGNVQQLEKEKLQLYVRRHGLLREGTEEDDTSERLSEIVEELRDVVGELRVFMMEEEVEVEP